MNDIIDSKSGRINIETYNSIQSIKYGLKASGKSAVNYFKKKDFLHERTDVALCQNMRSACHQYKQELERKKALIEKEKKLLLIEPKKSVVTKWKAKEIFAKAAKRSRLAYQQALSSGEKDK
jgi:hypothetical protein